MKKFFVFLSFLFLFNFLPVLAQTQNAGIIPANIWYSKDPFNEGDKIKIYTVVFNQDTRQLSGTVIFFDKDVFLGKKEFTVASKDTLDVSIDWTATAGSHTIFAKIENAKFFISPGKYEEVYTVDNVTAESKRNVSKKINSDSLIKGVTESGIVSSIKESVSENTPEFVTNAVDTSVSALEATRTAGSNYTEEKKQIVEKQIDELKKMPKKVSTTEAKRPGYLKPLKYFELFFLELASFIFKTKIVFYSLLGILCFFLLRYFWRLIF